ERQLVAIARAHLAGGDLLVLDEATSAVDPATEVRIAQALERLTAGRSTLTIAHRLSTAEAADLVVVVDEGEVVQVGPHSELVASEGIYAQLYGRGSPRRAERRPWQDSAREPRPHDLRPAQARRGRPRACDRPAARLRRGAHARLDGRRGAAPDPHDRARDLLVPLAAGVLAQGRHLGSRPARALGRARLRRRRAPRARRAGRARVPHGDPLVLRGRR